MEAGGAPEDPARVAHDDDAGMTWVLVRQVPKNDDLGLNAGFTELRDVDPEERARILAAEAAFDRFGAKWGHTEMVRRAMAVSDAVDGFYLAHLRSLEAVNQADLERVRSAFVQFTRHVASWVAAGQQMTGDLGQLASAVAQSPALHACFVFASDAARVAVTFAQQGRSSVLAATRRDGSGRQVGDAHDAVALVNRTVQACEAFASAELVAAEADLLAAGRVLLSLQAEIVYGFPALAPPLTDAAQGRQLELRTIGVAKVTPVMYALEIAARRLAAWRAQTPAGEAEAAPSDTLVSQPAGATGPSAVTENDERLARARDEVSETAVADESAPHSTAAQPDVDRVGDNKTPPGAAPESMSPITPPRPIDLGGLLEEVLAFSDEAQQRWFEALGRTMHGDVRDLQGRMQSLLVALNAEIQARAAADAARGFSPELPALPLDAHDANRLEVDAEGQQRVTQYGIGLIAVVSNVVRALEELDQPTAVQVQLPSGAAMLWWSPDVFTRVREAAKLAIRLFRDPLADSAAGRTNTVELAVAAWLAGLPEAAALYVVCSLDAAVERNGPLAAAFDTLHSIVSRLLEGTPASVDTLVAVTNFWLQELNRRAQAAAPSGEEA
jgi:hypothetical protein